MLKEKMHSNGNIHAKLSQIIIILMIRRKIILAEISKFAAAAAHGNRG